MFLIQYGELLSQMNLSVGVATYSSISYHSIFQNMTDNGVDMVGGDSSNQGQVR